jgi:hypothetical protein
VDELSLRVEQKRRALNAHALLAVHVFFDDHAERIAELGVHVGKEPERDLVFRLELLVRGDGIAADADDDRALLLEVVGEIAELRSLVRTTRRIVFGIEIYDERLAEQVLRGYLLAAVVGELQRRQLCAGFEHAFFPSREV